MAKIVFGDVIVDKRGSQGGTVYSRNGHSAYTRNRVVPSNPSTISQSLARARLGTYSQGWRALTDAQRTEWNNAVSLFPYTDPVTGEYLLTGQALYIALNTSLLTAGAAAITVPPAPGAVTNLASVTVTMAKGTPAVSATFTVSPVAAGMAIVVRATNGLSAGRNFASSEFAQITVLAAAATSPANLLTAYTTKYGVVPAAGLKVFFEFYAVNTATGQQSARLRTSCIVAA